MQSLKMQHIIVALKRLSMSLKIQRMDLWITLSKNSEIRINMKLDSNDSDMSSSFATSSDTQGNFT